MNYIFTDNFDQGVGNQLFPYFYGIIFSKLFNVPYFHPGIKSLKIEPNPKLLTKPFSFHLIRNFKEQLEKKNYNPNINYQIEYQINPTIEDYRIFKDHIPYLKMKYPIKKINIDKDDLVYHFRAGDNLFTSNYILFNGDKLEQLLKKIKYKNLYVVTNSTQFKAFTLEQYKKSRQYYLKNGFHTTPYREENCIQPVKFNEVLNRINGVINVLNKYKCIWISDSVYKDFNYIRNFNKIIIAVSTLSWWAAVLSDAEEVYAPAKWKWYKRKRNKNLPHINLQGWRAVDL